MTHHDRPQSTTAAPRGHKEDDARVFIVEDDPAICDLLAETLSSYQFLPATFTSAEPALTALKEHAPAAVILDLGLPDMDGMRVIERIRAVSALPILVLSARTHASDKIMGLEFGADDYVVKPFDPREIVARLRSLLRRSGPSLAGTVPSETREPVARFAGWRFEPGSHRLVAPDGAESFLSTGEAVLLTALLKAPRRVLSRDHLLEHGGRDDTLDRSIDVRISRIRKKLTCPDAAPVIRTVYGSGYMLTAHVDWDK